MYFSYVWGQINFCTPEPCPKGDHVDIGVGTWGGTWGVSVFLEYNRYDIRRTPKYKGSKWREIKADHWIL